MSPTTARILVQWVWSELVLIEPDLATVERLAINLHPSHPDREDWLTLTGMLRPLVGDAAIRPELRDWKPWAVAVEHIRRCWETGSAEEAMRTESSIQQ